jgi:RiboL-PSP-HEPN
MTTDDFVAELFQELDWRLDEIQKLKNLFGHELDRPRRDDLRKALVVVLYAHFEGFCAFALAHYLNGVNQAKLECRQAVPAILAGSWERVFNAMEHGDQKSEIFRKSLPADSRLHRQWRRRHFVEEIDRFLSLPVSMPEDIVDAESNLKPAVLKRNLFVLGIDHTFVDRHADALNNLLGRRNRIAHGEDRRGVNEREYNQYEAAVFEICFRLIELMEDGHFNQRYCKTFPDYVI